MKRRNKVSAEFSMSSLTDIIFLLLIFFMLTSSAIQVNMELPKSDAKTVAPVDLVVTITKNGDLKFNGKRTTWSNLPKRLALNVRSSNNKGNATVNIVSENGVPWDQVHRVMKMAAQLRLKAIIATQPG